MEYTTEFYTDHNYERFLEVERRSQVLNTANKVNPTKVLDVGPGLMQYYNIIPNWSSYLIIDPVQEFIDSKPAHVEGICSTLEDVEITDKFDLIILSGMLHLSKDRDLFLEKIYGLCHDDTIIHINVPNAESFHRILGYNMGLLEDVRDQSENDLKYKHGKNFTKSDLMILLSKNNFHVDLATTYAFKPFSDKQMVKILTPELMVGLNKMQSLFNKYGCEIVIEARKESKHCCC